MDPSTPSSVVLCLIWDVHQGSPCLQCCDWTEITYSHILISIRGSTEGHKNVFPALSSGPPIGSSSFGMSLDCQRNPDQMSEPTQLTLFNAAFLLVNLISWSCYFCCDIDITIIGEVRVKLFIMTSYFTL